jgi:hypothetical protein
VGPKGDPNREKRLVAKAFSDFDQTFDLQSASNTSHPLWPSYGKRYQGKE